MTGTRSRWYKPMLVVLAIALLASTSWLQRGLNRTRGELGFTRVAPLKNAPPMLVLTTVVLGGFRGLIANALWVRAMDLQDEDKFFEMVQLADWITKLQPHINTVWIVQAWNMAYNISIKFTEPSDRWRWVKGGFELLRDEALKWNPHEVMLYRELAWIFQHKIGANLDDAHLYFKSAWAGEMQAVLKGGRPNWDELINPRTPEAQERVRVLREKYKLDPVKMKAVDDRYGPLEWRLPETQAIYWASIGREMAKRKDELINLRRVIFQSMQLAFQRGRFIEHKFDKIIEFGPNIDIIPKTNDAYEEMMAEDVEMREHISRGHKNFLLQAVYSLYLAGRRTEALRWLAVVKEKYPHDFAPNLSLDDYAVGIATEDFGETNMDRTKASVEALFSRFFYNLTIGEEEQAQSYRLLAQNVWQRYQGKIINGPSGKRVGLPPLAETYNVVLERLLGEDSPWPPDARAQLRTALGLGAAATNAPPAQATPPTAANTNTTAAPKPTPTP